MLQNLGLIFPKLSLFTQTPGNLLYLKDKKITMRSTPTRENVRFFEINPKT